MAVKKITKRWIFNSFGAILVILIALEIAIAVSVKNYYYSSVKRIVSAQAETISGLLSEYSTGGEGNYESYFRSLVASFDKRNIMELMVLDKNGRAVITSSGFVPETSSMTADCTDALSSLTGSAEFVGGMAGGEKVYSMTVVPNGSTDNFRAFRLVTSLKRVDTQITVAVASTGLICVAIIFFVIASGSYFINSIVIPVGQIGDAARKIAEGDFNSRIEKTTDDEIGDLVDTINYMADELGATEKMKNEFISSVSHELRTPLTAITGWAETLAYDEAIRGDSRRGIEIITREAGRLTKMVEELLEFTRIQDGRFTLHVSTVELPALVEDCLYTYNELFRHEDLAVTYVSPEEDLPEIPGDPERLSQVFLNILDNACKYGKNGKKIDVNITHDDATVSVCIRDYGPGIPPAELPQVKKKFFKGSSKERGSGIGLAVCDEIVTRHNGTLDIANAAGGGVRVTVTLPRKAS